MLLKLILYGGAFIALVFTAFFIIPAFFTVRKPIEETDLLDQDCEYYDNVKTLPKERDNEPTIRKVINL